jgi:hypothetical protein
VPNNRNREGTVYLSTGNPDTVNENYSANLVDTAYAGGELGTSYSWKNKRYQIVQCEPGAGIGVTGPVAANQLAFWYSRQGYLVTNDPARAEVQTTPADFTSGMKGLVAGRFGTAVKPGNICHIQQAGPALLLATSTTLVAGAAAIPHSGPTAERSVSYVPLGQPAAQYPVVGITSGVVVNGLVPVDMDIQPIE